MKLKMLLMASCLLLPMSSAFAEEKIEKTPIDYQLESYKKEADIGNTEAAKKYEDLKEAVEKAKVGDPDGQYKVAKQYIVQNRYNKIAEELLLKAANQGHIKAQYQLLKWYMLASEGHLRGDPKKGSLWPEEVNIPDSKKKMLFWMNKLVEEGDPRMQNLLGKAYLEGKYGLDKNYNQARALFEKSADQGYSGGLKNLAECYEDGLGVHKDINKAISLYDQAGQKGDGFAYIKLRDMYKRGSEDIPQDLEKAQEYNEKARQVGPGVDELDIWLMMPF